MKKYVVAVVGATGVVGRKLIEVLEERKFPVKKIVFLASKKSVGKFIEFENQEIMVQELLDSSFEGVDIAFFCVNKDLSAQYVPKALEQRCLVIDNSSCFRLNKNIPLVAYNVNNDDIGESCLIANPNCSTIQSVLPLKVLQDNFGLVKVSFATYQSVSGSGMGGIRDLIFDEQEFYPYRVKYTCIPCIGSGELYAYTSEEIKMIEETRKILHQPDLKINATCIRVPVLFCHGVLIEAELEKEFTIQDIKQKLSECKDIVVIDDLENDKMPNSIDAVDNDYIYVGRIRKNQASDNGVVFYCVSDNLRRGAASNAIFIAE